MWYYVYDYYKKDENWNNKIQQSLKGLDYSNLPEKIKKENIQKLYGNKLKTSVSKLEQYRRCPFSYFLQYGLKNKTTRRIKSTKF